MRQNIFEDVSAGFASEISAFVGHILVHLPHFAEAVFENESGAVLADVATNRRDRLARVHHKRDFVVRADDLQPAPLLDRRFQFRNVDFLLCPACDFHCVTSSIEQKI